MNSLNSSFEKLTVAALAAGAIATAKGCAVGDTAELGAYGNYPSVADATQYDGQTSADATNGQDDGDNGATDDGFISPPDSNAGEDAQPSEDNGPAHGEDATPDAGAPSTPDAGPAAAAKPFPQIERIDCSPESLQYKGVPVERILIVEPGEYKGEMLSAQIYGSDIDPVEQGVNIGKLMVGPDGNLTYKKDLSTFPNKDVNGGKDLFQKMGGVSLDAVVYGNSEATKNFMKDFMQTALSCLAQGNEVFEKYMQEKGFTKNGGTTKELDSQYESKAGEGTVTTFTTSSEVGNPAFNTNRFPLEAWVKPKGAGSLDARMEFFKTILPICNPTQAQNETHNAVQRVFAKADMQREEGIAI